MLGKLPPRHDRVVARGLLPLPRGVLVVPVLRHPEIGDGYPGPEVWRSSGSAQRFPTMVTFIPTPSASFRPLSQRLLASYHCITV